ncbi:hypothetical protein DFP72DRAFT_892515 [Ephemerocybe angulata]|uniref:F-box domain-containing protein n=1 Tax=Ephemerocybe angulata TaxID=980116 RepID=A0A8H6I2S9_9AGAR|nr:hypothetical protein DFP72DRAFT_892515 [Tulosesus angulatus]
MKKLPIELQTLIVKELPTRDICRLQQTCKAFYDSIESNPEVWRECLRRQCSTDVLWSSFSGFTASELRRACTGTLRFKHRYRPGGHSKPPIPRLLPYNNQQSQGSDNPYPEIQATFLIPGGRFLITVDKKWLRVWDLGPPGSLVEPCESASRELNCTDKALEIADVVVTGKDMVHLLIQEWYSEPTLPQSFGIDRSEYNYSHWTTFTLFHRFEIRLPGRGQHSVRELGRLCVLHSSVSDICTTQDGPIVALGIGERVLLWGTSDSPDKSWVASRTGCGGTDGQDVFLHQGYAFIVDSDGLSGFDLTGITHRPVGKGLVDIQYGTPDIGHIPTPQKWSHQQDFQNTLRGWASDFMLHKPPAEGGPLFYDIRLPQLGAALPQPLTYESHDSYLQFCFSFHPDNPSASSLIPTKRYMTASQPCDTPHFHFALDEGVRGYIWYDYFSVNGGVERRNIFVSILDDPDFPEPSGSIFEGLGDFSEMIVTGPIPESTRVLHISVCPLSGRVVVLWDRESKNDRLVEIFDLYDFSLTT